MTFFFWGGGGGVGDMCALSNIFCCVYWKLAFRIFKQGLLVFMVYGN